MSLRHILSLKRCVQGFSQSTKVLRRNPYAAVRVGSTDINAMISSGPPTTWCRRRVLARPSLWSHPATGCAPPRRWHTDEADGVASGATVDIVNDPDEDSEIVFVNAFSPVGFTLSNKFNVVGPCVLFPGTVMCWHVGDARDITPESLTLFTMIEPKLDLLVIGIGDGRLKPDVQKIISFCRRAGINVEILGTEEACATYNFMANEQRLVAAALIPPEEVNLFRQPLYVGEDFWDVEEKDSIDQVHPDDPSHPKNWLSGKPMGPDYDMTTRRDDVLIIGKEVAAEIRHTEALMAKEIAAMEDRFDEHGQKLKTDLEAHHRVEVTKDYKEAAKSGRITDRIILDLDARTPAEMTHELERYRTESWGPLEQSQRYRKRFGKLYDVGQDDSGRDEAMPAVEASVDETNAITAGQSVVGTKETIDGKESEKEDGSTEPGGRKETGGKTETS